MDNMKWLIIVGTIAVCYGGDSILEDANVFEGDMILRPEQKVNIELSIKGLPTFAASTFARWPIPVPYEIENSLKNQPIAVRAIKDAIKDIEDNSCVKFRQKNSGDKAYIQFLSGGGCMTNVGYFKTVNYIILGPRCWHKYIAIHEILHSLGFYHEQSRPDRDRYVRVIYNNIPHNLWRQFRKYNYGHIDSKGSPYDYYSIMHYSKTAFGSGKITIETYDRNMRDVIGTQKKLSKHDIQQLNTMYNCRGGPKPGACKDVNPTSYCQRYRSYCSKSPDYKAGCRKTCGAC